MRRVAADTWVALVLLAACGVFLHDLMGTGSAGAFVKTTTLPIALVVTIALLSLILLGGSLLRPVGPPAGPGDGDSRRGLARVLAMIVWTAGYIAALPWLGFLASSAVYLVGGALLYGNRRPVAIVAVAVLTPLALLLFFEEFMIVLLPSSRLFD